ncbi:hypothetical protein [Catellatospora sp. NPDC049609]|uniref:hypothetical protein n=1 Tax=Catellatospora sp. NPDC049609 TaxID=3155505 RepID=UPI00342741D1
MTAQDDNPSWIVRNGPKTALFAAAGLTMIGEFELAQLAHYPLLLCILFPLAVDVYAWTAFEVGRRADVAVSIALMLTAQIASHLAKAGLIPLTGTSGIVFTVTTVSIPPIIAWRAHHIAKPKAAEPVKAEEPAQVEADEVVIEERPKKAAVRRSKAETARLVQQMKAKQPRITIVEIARRLDISEKWASECLRLDLSAVTA